MSVITTDDIIDDKDGLSTLKLTCFPSDCKKCKKFII